MNNGNVSLPTDLYPWTTESMLEVILPDPDSFLKIRETLTRIGVASKREKTLYQSAHILHKQGKYYIMHFKEMFKLDGKNTDLTVDDVRRRNTIARLLEEWQLCKIVETDLITTSTGSLKIIPYSMKKEWQLLKKYSMLSDRNVA
jgi:hypothetical protein